MRVEGAAAGLDGWGVDLAAIGQEYIGRVAVQFSED
jgi:hypothetical protein